MLAAPFTSVLSAPGALKTRNLSSPASPSPHIPSGANAPEVLAPGFSDLAIWSRLLTPSAVFIYLVGQCGWLRTPSHHCPYVRSPHRVTRRVESGPAHLFLQEHLEGSQISNSEKIGSGQEQKHLSPLKWNLWPWSLILDPRLHHHGPPGPPAQSLGKMLSDGRSHG